MNERTTTSGLEQGIQLSDSVKQAVEKFTTTPHTPELYTSTFEAIWQERQQQLQEEKALMMFPCPYTQKDIDGLEIEGRRIGYLPIELSSRQTRSFMGEIWPQMVSSSVREDNSVSDMGLYGWFDYEGSIDAPYTNTTEEQLTEINRRQARDGRYAMSLNEYIIAAQDSKLFTDCYLDENLTMVRLPGSRGKNGKIIVAYFDESGRLYVDSSRDPQYHLPILGSRTTGSPEHLHSI